jgi:SAM-dependent methyltransferase
VDKSKEWWGKYSVQSHQPPEPWRQELIREVLKTGPSSVLEFGCNSGNNLFHLMDQSPDIMVRGIDINKDAIRKAHLRAKSMGLIYGEYAQMRFILGDEDALELESRADVVLCSSVLDHNEDPGHILDRLVDVTRFRLLILEPYYEGFEGTAVGFEEGYTDTPYTWYHDYPKLLDGMGVSWSSRPLPIPSLVHKSGRFYTLFEVSK